MASYYDSYDKRPRPPQYDDAYQRSRDEFYLRPTAAARATDERYGRSGEGAARTQNPSSNMNDTNPQKYDPRHSYPPPLPASAGPPPRQRQPTGGSRVSWPPQPTCEDEVASLAKEAGSQSLLKEVGKDDAVLRGAVDQYPIVQDVPEPTVKPEKQLSDGAKSFRSSKSSGVPTPPTSDDEKARKASRRPSKLNMDFKDIKNTVPEFNKRTASPYAFSQDSGLKKNKTPKNQFLSPESYLSPPPTESRRKPKKHVYAKSQPSSPNRDPPQRSSSSANGDDYFSLSAGESAIDDKDYDTDRSASSTGRRKPSTYPSVKSQRPDAAPPPQSAVVDFAPQASTAPPRKLNLDARRNTDTGGALPTFDRLHVDKTRRPTPLMTSSAISDINDSAIYSSPTTPHSTAEFPLSRSQESSYTSKRSTSPARSATDPLGTTTPPRTPRTSFEISREANGDYSPASRTNSISGSANGSRPSSPSPRTPNDASRLPKTDLDWSTLLAANTARRSNPPPRVASIRQDSLPSVSRLDTRALPNRNSSLPYPVDDGPSTPTAWMPSERSHQYFPEPRPNLLPPFIQEAKTLSRAASPAPRPSDSSTARPSSARSSRPFFQPRHSAVDLPTMEKQQSERPRAAEPQRVSSFNDPSQARRDAQALAEKALPDCSRSTPVAGKTDWYTMTGAPSLDFCPDCIDYMERTVFRLSFRKSPPRNLEKKVTCALGGMPWIRLAWLMTLQRKRSDLNLLKDVAEIEETTEPCAGSQHTMRSWYGLRDPDGLFVKDFAVCYNDVKKLERLFPSLYGMFVPVPHRMSYEKHICAIRTDGNRFGLYLEALVTTHEKAVASRRSVDPLPFIQLVEKRQRLRECTKDSMLWNQLWHFIPGVPELTVCEDCFETIVEPEVKNKKALAMKFNRTIQPVYGETFGNSCQLYSPRMRKIFSRAVRENDVSYLARKARERRDAEFRLQDKMRAVNQKSKRLSMEGSTSGLEDEERRLDREKRRIAEEWQNHWE